ncbi:uncharacterized protein DSM5745_05564 [Aspergillus mulundensis]|uniref:Integral membrane protein n=1 Tax=Aspergillus mulundensis TaxID=1810919 RepID=A0A3D8RXB9_9EURO|nr:hypothetical protein DSM5745_05564 [Aspergillus mulundensis]RDW78712.1 hypothetical protein DSM5745_05564 [Aspergillus mulundensis]
MDPIEPAGPSPDHLAAPRPQPRRASSGSPSIQEATSSSNPPGRPRAASIRSNHSNRSSIRLTRPPSFIQSAASPQPGNSNFNFSFRNNGSRASVAIDPASPREERSDPFEGGRRRSNSEPRPGRWSAPTQTALLPRLQPGEPMHTVMEEPQSPASGRRPTSEFVRPSPIPSQPLEQPQPRDNRSAVRRKSEAALNRFSRNRASTVSGTAPMTGNGIREYESHVVDVLDVIDPEVSALTTLTNVQNSLFVPNLGSLINRNQTYTLSPPRELDREETTSTEEEEDKESTKGLESRPALERPITSISSVLDGGEPRFAVLPEGINLEGWSYQDIEELNDHVRHMLHSRRSKFKRSMKGFGKYVRKPLGFLITLYATLITLFGLAWVLFLIGWINVGGRQSYIINVIDNVLVALFAIMGDGLAPFRAVDTYHMIFIARYTFLTWRIRKKRRLPELKDKNDLPSRGEAEADADLEAGQLPKEDEHEFSVLSIQQQAKLQHHQAKFAKSHTFYKPHETITHHAFPQRFLIAIVVLLDCHSLLQIALGACTWGISYHVRPFALTTVILCCSITCNITGGVLIMIGDRRTRKKDVVERMFRQQLTKEAMKKMQKKRRKQDEKANAEDPELLSDSTSNGLQVHQST